MAYETPIAPTMDLDDLMMKLQREKKAAQEFQERKHADWNENYELSRNKVRTNRLTQRQAVNIPLMKETEKTILSRIDDPPSVDWKEKSGDELKELIFQEIWDEQFRKGKFEWKDVLDKKNVLRYGLSTKMLNPKKDKVDVQVLDVFDVVFDPLMNPMDIETARFIVRQNIFRSLREVLADERYTEEGKNKLKIWATTDAGLVQSTQNKEEMDERNERLKAMGVGEAEFALFAGGEVVVNLSEHFTLMWNAKKKEFEKRVVVYADDCYELLNDKLEDLIGVDFWPFVVWMEDPETNDIYPDSVDDMVRVPNKLANIWFSQQAENRTLQNFQMHWYDATIQGYQPQTYEPGPGRMLPAPGDPNKTIMPVQVNGLDETFNAIEFVTRIVERATGATAIEKGVGETGTQTLGEIEILVGKAMERASGITKFYRGSWYELAWKWEAMMQANASKKMTLYKTGRSGKVFSKTVYPSEWKSEAGYEPMVRSTSEQEQEETKTIQKFQFVLSQFPNNPVLRRIAQKRELEILDLSPDELKQVEDAEKEMQQIMEQQQMMQQQMAQQGQQSQQTQPAVQKPSPEDLAPELEQLSQLMA